jgi:acetyl esterase/lipase
MPLTVTMMNLMARVRGMERVQVSSTPATLDNARSQLIDTTGSARIPRRAEQVTSVRKVRYAAPTLRDGSSKALYMDILTPPGPGPFPAIVYVSGGGFLVSVRRAAARQRGYLASAGFVVASIDYRVIPDGATWHDGVADVRAAVRYLRANAKDLNIDEQHIGVWGESAGGYLSSMTGATAAAIDDVGDNPTFSGAVQASVSFFGAGDLSRMAAGLDEAARAAATRPDNPVARYVVGVTNRRGVLDMPEEVQQANPVSYATPDGPPFLLFHGDDDRIVSPLQTQQLHHDLLERGVSSVRYVVRNAGHGILGDHAKLWLTRAVMDPTVAFFNEHLKPDRPG